MTPLDIQLAAAPLIRDELDMIMLTGSDRAAADLVREHRLPELYLEMRCWQARYPMSLFNTDY
jgi:hypothetical protein